MRRQEWAERWGCQGNLWMGIFGLEIGLYRKVDRQRKKEKKSFDRLWCAAFPQNWFWKWWSLVSSVTPTILHTWKKQLMRNGHLGRFSLVKVRRRVERSIKPRLYAIATSHVMAKVPFQNMCWGCGQWIWGPKKRWLIDDWVRKGEKWNSLKQNSLSTRFW